MMVLYQNSCYNELCYKGTAMCIFTPTVILFCFRQSHMHPHDFIMNNLEILYT